MEFIDGVHFVSARVFDQYRPSVQILSPWVMREIVSAAIAVSRVSTIHKNDRK